MMRVLMAMLAACVLSACATQTPYQPASADRYGFSEQRIETNRIRITFRGNALTDRETVETYLLYRAAEVTIASRQDYFIVADRGTDAQTTLQGSPLRPRFAFDYWYFSPRFGWRPWYDPFWDEPDTYRQITRYEAMAEIAMFSGQKPANDANAFDAREVIANLQGKIVRPAPPR